MKIYVIRHGQTDLNRDMRAQGRKGLPLNQTGLLQAEALGRQLQSVKFDFVFSSPQPRAIQTAEIASKTVPITDERLDVFDLGSADGKKMCEIKTIHGGLLPDPEVYTDAEDINHYVKRVYSFFDDLVQKYRGQDVNILVCGHKCTTGCAAAYFEGMPADGNFLALSTKNAGLKIFDESVKVFDDKFLQKSEISGQNDRNKS